MLVGPNEAIEWSLHADAIVSLVCMCCPRAWLVRPASRGTSWGSKVQNLPCSYAKWEMMNPIGCAIVSGLLKNHCIILSRSAH